MPIFGLNFTDYRIVGLNFTDNRGTPLRPPINADAHAGLTFRPSTKVDVCFYYKTMCAADDVGQYRDRFCNEGTAVYALYALQGHKHT